MKGYSPSAPTSHVPVASTRPPPSRSEKAARDKVRFDRGVPTKYRSDSVAPRLCR